MTQALMVGFILVAMSLVLITPTRWGIWSAYSVSYAAGHYVVVQSFHVFGFRWTKAWYGSGEHWLAYRDDINQYDAKVSEHRAAWLNKLVLQWGRAYGR